MLGRNLCSASIVLASIFSIGAADIVRGVNLGGWLVTEPWMTPSLFTSTDTADEWHLCNVLGKKQCLQTLQQHWSTFYTKDDFEQIKNAGLTAVRIPLGYWAVDLLDYEPYVSGQYPYLIQAVQWAQQLGLNVFIDLHGAPGSQNGWEETGLVGPVLFPANSSNSERSVNVLKNLTQEFSQDTYKGVVTNIEVLNEPLLAFPVLTKFYTDAAQAVNGSGINVTISDGFLEPHTWENYDPNNPSASAPAEFLTVDTHQFWGFPPLNNLSKPQILERVCQFGQQQLKLINSEYTGIPPTLVGEWSLDTGVTANSTSNTEEDQDKRTWFRTLFEAQNAAFTPNGPNQPSVGWYFWAWKTEYDIDAWSYRKGLADQYIPANISDPKSLVFPINDNGCIDTNFKYTAPATVTSSSLGAASGTASATSGSTASSSSDAKSSTHQSWSPESPLRPWLVWGAIASLSFLFML